MRYLSVELSWEIGIGVGQNSPWRTTGHGTYELEFRSITSKFGSQSRGLFLVLTPM